METAIHSSAPGPSRGLHYHASTQTSRAVVLQRDNQTHTMSHNSTRGADILSDQYTIDTELKDQEEFRTKHCI